MILETKRLLLKSYKHEFADVIYPVVSQAEIADTVIAIPHPYPKTVVNQWIDYLQNSAKQGTAFEFAIFSKEYPGKYIGNCGLVSISRNHQKAEIAYFIDKNEWGKGYATEVALSMISYGFEKLGLERIYGHCMSRNPASRKVMEKIGFQFEGTLRHDVKKEKYLRTWIYWVWFDRIMKNYMERLLHISYQKDKFTFTFYCDIDGIIRRVAPKLFS